MMHKEKPNDNQIGSRFIKLLEAHSVKSIDKNYPRKSPEKPYMPTGALRMVSEVRFAEKRVASVTVTGVDTNFLFDGDG